MRFAVAILLVALTSVDADAMHGHEWHWSSEDRTVEVHDEMVRTKDRGLERRRWRRDRDRALRVWEAAGAVEFVVMETDQVRPCEPLEYDVWTLRLCPSEGGGSWAWSAVHWSPGHIYASVVAIRPDLRRGLQGIFCHEVGHTLGLDERADFVGNVVRYHPRTCMAPGAAFRFPDAHDLSEVSAAHAHDDHA